MRNWTYHVAGTWQNLITSRRRWQRDQTPIQKQTKHRTQQTKHKAQRCLSKKKKISNTQTKIKPSKPLTHGRSRRRSELIVVVVVRLVAPHRRSKIGERRSLCLCSGARCSLLDAPSGPPSRYFALFSLWLFLSLSLFNLYLSLSLGVLLLQGRSQKWILGGAGL